MTHPSNHHSLNGDSFDPTDNSGPAAQSWSRTAVLAAMFCVPFCCPPMTLIGAGTGVLALWSIRKNPDTKGAWLARSAILFGVAATVLSVWLFWVSGLRTIVIGPGAALAPLFAADTQGMHREWAGPAGAMSREELAAFAGQVQSRYGRFVSCQYSVARPTPLEQPGKQSVAVIPITIQFESTVVEADLGLERFNEKTGQSTMVWRSLRILDPVRGELLFPAGEPPPPTLESLKPAAPASRPPDPAPGGERHAPESAP